MVEITIIFTHFDDFHGKLVGINWYRYTIHVESLQGFLIFA